MYNFRKKSDSLLDTVSCDGIYFMLPFLAVFLRMHNATDEISEQKPLFLN